MSKLYTMIFAVFAAFVAMAHGALNYKDANTLNRFSTWMNRFNIESKDETHLAHIFDNWISNDKYIEEVNGQNRSFTLGHNAFSGMNSDEFSEYMGFIQNKEVLSKGLRGSMNVPIVDQVEEFGALPSSYDWRSKGVVSAIRDQGQCGSCWAFSGTSTLESAVAIKSGKLYDLSEQQGVDCSTIRNGYSNMGCSGGMYDTLWKFVTDNNGLCSESAYPYTSGTTTKTGTCQKTCTPVSGTKVSSYVKVTPYSDTSMMNALTVNPVSIAVYAAGRSFQLYNSGIYDDFTGCGGNNPELDHAVVLVGWGSSNGQDYYILRNSWGTSWGDMDSTTNNGYMLIARGSAYGKAGMCGLLSEPYYPVV